MATKTTVACRSAVAGLLVLSVPAGLHWYRVSDRLDTDAMLDVSVTIRTVSHVRVDEVGDSVWETASGSGFLVSADGCEVWTNHHVVAEAAIIEVYPRGWRNPAGIPARMISGTPRGDVAVIRMERCDGIPVARVGDSATLRPGDEIYAVGNPLGKNPDSISRGIISHLARYVDGATAHLQTDLALNRGHSGGALFNREGEVVGVNTAIATDQKGSGVGIGYALPIDLVKGAVEELRAGPPSWGDLGISGMVASLTPDEAEVFHVPPGHAAIVLTETPGKGPAAGKLRAHDAIYRVGEVDVVDGSQVMRVAGSRRPGDTVTLQLVRAGELESVEITLGEGWTREDRPGAEYFEGLLGMTVEMWDERDGDEGRIETPVITKVHGLGPAHRAQIASSQKTMIRRGPFVTPFQLDVKTVTGIVLDGAYRPVSDVDDLERYANEAFLAAAPLLLEIELWRREQPYTPASELEHVGRAYFRVTPQVSTAAAPEVDGEDVIGQHPDAFAGEITEVNSGPHPPHDRERRWRDRPI